ncbi:MAG: hypothetical protein Q7W55_15910 [Pseudohongiella sp.]|nr:hypothetical protein [Pseudohongiella sp.]
MRKEYDFAKSKNARDIEHLAKLHSIPTGKTRIVVKPDNKIIGSPKKKNQIIR